MYTLLKNSFKSILWKSLLYKYHKYGLQYSQMVHYAFIGVEILPPCYNMAELIKSVGDLIGHGSYLMRTPEGDYAKNDENENIKGRLGYANDQLKEQIVDVAYKAARAANWHVLRSSFFCAFDDIHIHDIAIL